MTSSSFSLDYFIDWNIIETRLMKAEISPDLKNSTNIKRLRTTITSIFQKGIENYPPPPRNKEEQVEVYSEFFKKHSSLFHVDRPGNDNDIINRSYAIADLYLNVSLPEKLLLLGQRITPASIQTEDAIPPLNDVLFQQSQVMFNDKLTVLTRAWSKHVSKCPVEYWGTIKGSPADLNSQSFEILRNLVNENITWWNAFGHFKHGFVFEVRDSTGHGARWRLGDWSFIGLVEAIDAGSKNTFVTN